MKTSNLILAFLFATTICNAQKLPIAWTVNGTTVTVLEDANNVVLRVGTNQKAIAKTAFTKLSVIVHDTVWRVLDPKRSADYLALAEQFAETMAELQHEKLLKEQALAENDQLQTQYANAVRTMKWLDEQLKKDTVIQVRFSREMLLTLPVRRP